MVADKSLGLTFFNDVGAIDAQVSYFKRLGGSRDGKQHNLSMVFCPHRSWWEPLKEGTGRVSIDRCMASIVTCIQRPVHFISH